MKFRIYIVLGSLFIFACSGGNAFLTVEIDGQKTEVSYKVSKSDSMVVRMTSYHENGQTSIDRFYKKGIPHGNWIWYSEEGNRDTLRVYKDSLLDGKSRGWHKNGELLFEQIFKNGQKVGNWRTWYDDQTLRSASEYNEDLLNGTVAEWYSSGILSCLKEYSEGKINGTVSKWSPKGRLVSHSVYIEGIPHFNIIWHDSGELRNVTAFRQGQEEWVIHWDRHGRRISQPLHEKHEIHRELGRLGHRKVEADFIGEKKHGVELQWHVNGKISIIRLYVRNRIVYERITNDKGEFELETVSVKGQLLWSRKNTPKIPS